LDGLKVTTIRARRQVPQDSLPSLRSLQCDRISDRRPRQRFGSWSIQWPIHVDRIEFLRADIAGHQRRIVWSNSKPFHDRSDRQAPDSLEIHDGLDLAITQPESGDAPRDVLTRRMCIHKVDIFSVV